MCLDVRRQCECGKEQVQFHLRDNIMVPEVISRVLCPSCSGNAPFNGDSMLNDNNWIIEYDMPLAQTLASKKLGLDSEEVSPEYIFDQGYACWLEMYPGEREEIKEERDNILKLLKIDQGKYLKKMQSWNIKRVEGLKEAGWRKAQQA